MKVSISLIIILLAQINLNGQSIRGNISDERNNSLPYANIGIVGSSIGTISSNDGSFLIDISGIDNNKVLRFSYVGFESVDHLVGNLRSKQIGTLNIKLEEKTIRLKDVIIKPGNTKPLFLGSNKKGRYKCVWNDAKKGAEIGSIFHLAEPIVLEEFLFHININRCDSIYYRLRIYSIENNYPKEILNTKDIRFISKLRKGWESVDLSSYNISVESDFFITLETLDSWSSGNERIAHLSVRGVDAHSFSKESSMAKWTRFGDQMGFRIRYSKY